jgi:hypothetical protein
MKRLIIILCFLLSNAAIANESKTNSEELSRALNKSELISKMISVNKAQNKVMMKGSSVQDIEQLFDLYTDDFIYVHEVYGGKYTKEHLYNNTVKYLQSGGYNKISDRYTIASYIVGVNTIAVQRLADNGILHLAVFEFTGDKVKKITEYWK